MAHCKQGHLMGSMLKDIGRFVLCGYHFRGGVGKNATTHSGQFGLLITRLSLQIARRSKRAPWWATFNTTKAG